jgi:hypothetical protein
VDLRQLGKLVLLAGLVLVVVGLALWSGLLAWFGRLPGDLRFEGENTRVYVPLTSMLLVSFALSVLIWLVRRSN